MPEQAKKQAATQKAAAPTIWEKLAEPFPSDQVEKLPRNVKARDDNRGKCEDTQNGRWYSADGHFCGGYHARAVHLDYVGHAGITMRLNDVLGPTGWEHRPLAMDSDGLPIMARDQFWATLSVTVDGETTTKMDVAADFNGPQEAWGDSLRRCASRFGVGTYLWSKSEAALALKRAEEPSAPEPQRPPERRQEATQRPQERPPHVEQVADMLKSLTDAQREKVANWWAMEAESGRLPTQQHWEAVTVQQAAAVEDMVVRIIEQDQQCQQEEAQGTLPPS